MDCNREIEEHNRQVENRVEELIFRSLESTEGLTTEGRRALDIVLLDWLRESSPSSVDSADYELIERISDEAVQQLRKRKLVRDAMNSLDDENEVSSQKKADTLE